MVSEGDQRRSESLDFSERLIPYSLIRIQKFGVGTLSRIPHFGFCFQNMHLKKEVLDCAITVMDIADMCDKQNMPPGGRNKIFLMISKV